MKKIITILTITLFFPVLLYSQITPDTIVKYKGDEIQCVILKETASRVIFNIRENGLLYKRMIPISEVSTIRNGYKLRENQSNIYLGFGLGLDYGGMPGANLMYTPMRKAAFYLGVGNAFNGVGINGGATYRFRSNKRDRRVVPFITGMYGYNAVIQLVNDQTLSKLFYGASFGSGIGLHRNPGRLNHWAFSQIVPLRYLAVNEYIDHLEHIYGVQFTSKLMPVLFSVGYKYAV